MAVMRAEELPARLWRRRHLRILASRRHRREAAERREIRRQPIHPAHERWLRYQAVGGHRCRPYDVPLLIRLRLASEDIPFTRGPAATVVLIDDEVVYAAEPDPPWVFPGVEP